MSFIHYTNINDNNIKELNKNVKQAEKEISHQKNELKLIYTEADKNNQKIKTQIKKSQTVKDYTPKQLIKIAAKEVGIDPALAVAISRLETGNYTSGVFKTNNNVGGMRNGDGSYITYDTLTEGVNAFVLCLKEVYYDNGMTTPEQIQPLYCPTSEGGNEWLANVIKLMVEEN